MPPFQSRLDEAEATIEAQNLQHRKHLARASRDQARAPGSPCARASDICCRARLVRWLRDVLGTGFAFYLRFMI